MPLGRMNASPMLDRTRKILTPRERGDKRPRIAKSPAPGAAACASRPAFSSLRGAKRRSNPERPLGHRKPPLDCFASLAMTNSPVLALRFLFAPRALPTMSRNGPPKGEAERRKARSQRPRLRTSGAPLEFALDRGARRFWRTRSPSGALPRLSPGFQAWLSPVPRFMVAATCATRAASSWQTGVEASRASFRTARG